MGGPRVATQCRGYRAGAKYDLRIPTNSRLSLRRRFGVGSR